MFQFLRFPYAERFVSVVFLWAVLSMHFNANAEAVLNRVNITPEYPTLFTGHTQAFTAVGTFSDGSSQHLLASPIVALEGGSAHSCALYAEGAVQCWGRNTDGQLGNGTVIDSTTPVRVTGINDATAVAVGSSHSCALLESGEVQCWGRQRDNDLIYGTSTQSLTPVTVSGISTAKALAARVHTCVLLSSGEVQCWGRNSLGQLGDGTNTSSTTPVKVKGISTATGVAVGTFHSCALLASGEVQCWGHNGYDQLGNGTDTNSSVPVLVSGITNATALGAGSEHTCAMLANNEVKCWGANFVGQLGSGSSDFYSSIPVSVSGINSATALAVNFRHSCALLVNGEVQCWGNGERGQLGNNITSDSFVPVTVSGISGATELLSGVEHSCALLDSGEVRCWGSNLQGQLGNGMKTYNASTTPVEVIGVNNAAMAAGSSSHSCAVIPGGMVQCWGRNHTGQLGNSSYIDSSTPVTVAGISNAVAVAVGGSINGSRSCALLASGEVQCWGDNGSGELGDGSYTNSTVPVTVTGISTAQALASGTDHSCALLDGGMVQCWGYNGHGQLGSNRGIPSAVPIVVNGVSNATALTAGENHTCALLSSREVQCWGSNQSGQLGNGADTSYSTTPVMVNGISSGIAVAAGQDHTCALLASGEVQCWGSNFQGGLGNGTLTASSTPVTVLGISTATALSAGVYNSCALLASSEVACWGYNYNEWQGNGENRIDTTPVLVDGLNDVLALATGGGHICAMLRNGAMQCWGDNSYGQLGNGESAYFPESVQLIGTPGMAIEWSSSDPSVASISDTGSAIGKSVGSAMITVTTGGLSASTTIDVQDSSQFADLSISMRTSQKSVRLDGTLIYTLTVTNHGPGIARKVRLNNTPHSTVEVLNIVPSKGTCGHWGRVKCWLGNLKSGASATVALTVKPTAKGLIYNFASTWSNIEDIDRSNNKAKATTRVW